MLTDVLILGGGAAGLMCAIEAGKRGRSVVVVEHTEKVGIKILISGGGRCNFTNIGASPRQFLSANPDFCRSALARYTAQDFIAFVEKHGIGYHEKKLGQLFCDNSSRDIVQMLERECAEAGVTVLTSHSVVGGAAGIERVNNRADSQQQRFTMRLTDTNNPANPVVVSSTALVVATGGPAIPKMGATGFGYDIARAFGLNVVPTKPALVPITTDTRDPALKRFAELSGISVDCVAAAGGSVGNSTGAGSAQSFRENLLFTHRGMSGPAVLQASSYWNEGGTMMFNTAPEVIPEAFYHEHRTSKVFVKNVLGAVVPLRFVEEFCAAYAPSFAKQMEVPFNQVSKQDFMRFAEQMQRWEIRPNGTEGYAKAEVTAGGVDTNELSQKTLESKNISGLYFIGEVVDVTGWLGGYNFQWAWSSGAAAGRAV